MKFFIEDGLEVTRSLKRGEDDKPVLQDDGEPHTITFRPLTGLEHRRLQAHFTIGQAADDDIPMTMTLRPSYADAVAKMLADHIVSWTLPKELSAKTIAELTGEALGPIVNAIMGEDGNEDGVEELAGN